MLLLYCVLFFFFKQKTAYELRISDWSSDVCSSDLLRIQREEMDGPHGIDDGDDPWKARDVEDAQRRQHQEINRHDGPEQRPHPGGAMFLDQEQPGQDDDGDGKDERR